MAVRLCLYTFRQGVYKTSGSKETHRSKASPQGHTFQAPAERGGQRPPTTQAEFAVGVGQGGLHVRW